MAFVLRPRGRSGRLPAVPALAALAPVLAAVMLALAGAGAARGEEAAHPFPLEVHYPNYFLTTWDFEPHRDRQDKEMKFQLSIQKRLFETVPFYFAYTQLALWQWYNTADSRPFRTQTHDVELYVDVPLVPQWAGKTTLRTGVEHQSNGQATADSRSWNRAYLWPRMEFPDLENLSVGVKGWWRFPESKKRNPDDPLGDDNRDIEDFLGKGELHLSQFSQGDGERLPYRRVYLMYRRGLRGDTDTVQLDLEYHLFRVWNFFAEGIYLHVQYFSGFGESLIDYNHRVRKLGLGFSFY